MIGGHGACDSSNSFPPLFISQTNVIGPTDLLEYLPVCHQSSSDAKPRTTQTDTMYLSDLHILFLTMLRLGTAYTLLPDWYMVKCTVYQSKQVGRKGAL